MMPLRLAIATCLTCREPSMAADLWVASVATRAYKCPFCGGHDLDTKQLAAAGARVGENNEIIASPVAAVVEAGPSKPTTSELPAAAGDLHPALEAAPAVKRGRRRKGAAT